MRIFAPRRLSLLCCIAVGLSTGCSTSAPLDVDNSATLEISARINDGMQRLGASPARGECYANRISRSLDNGEAAEAASLIEKSDSKDGMRDNVIAARAPITQAFIKAHFGCSLSS
jgi:hypothetical protein